MPHRGLQTFSLGSLILAVVLTPHFCAAQKILESEWKTGTLINVTSERGTRTVGSGSGGNIAVNTLRNDATYYEIDAGDLIYVAKRTLTRRGDKQLKLTVNAAVKFAIKKDDFYLLDEDGKQHKLSLEKKTLKPR